MRVRSCPTPRSLLTLLLSLIVNCIHAKQSTKQLGTNHHILFLLANVTPAHDFVTTLQSCGLEAAARVALKAGYQVKVLTTDAEVWGRAHAHLVAELPLEFAPLDAASLVHRTPLQAWYASGSWQQHPAPYQDLSNALRVAAVYKYGGMYVDSDMIITSAACTTLPAFVAKQDDEVVNNHFFRFPAGHPLLWLWMQRWVEACNPAHEYGACGPGVLHPLFHERCVDAYWPSLCTPSLPSNHTTPYAWDQVAGLLEAGSNAHYRMLSSDLYGVHWFATPMTKWNEQRCSAASSFLYAVAQDHCPATLQRNRAALLCSDVS